MTTENWVTLIISLLGIIGSMGWLIVGKYIREHETLRELVTGENGVYARCTRSLDERIRTFVEAYDRRLLALGESYQTKKETDLQFRHVMHMLEQARNDGQARHTENGERFGQVFKDMKDLREKVSELRESRSA